MRASGANLRWAGWCVDQETFKFRGFVWRSGIEFLFLGRAISTAHKIKTHGTHTQHTNPQAAYTSKLSADAALEFQEELKKLGEHGRHCLGFAVLCTLVQCLPLEQEGSPSTM